MTAAELIRSTRLEAGLTQSELAARMGVDQGAIARLERRGSNPTVATLDRALAATGRSLALGATRKHLPDVDEEQVRAHLAMSPTERLRMHTASQRNLISLLGKVR